MMFPQFKNKVLQSGKTGFTLIEVLVATTILLVIVILVSMVFQGSNTAFQAGSRKIASQTLIRNIIGMISRELSQAVDASDYPGMESLVSINTGSTITFLAMAGTPKKDMPDSTGAGTHEEHELQLITYSYEGGRISRTAQNVKCTSGQGTDNQGRWGTTGSPVVSYLNSNSQKENLNSFQFTVVNEDCIEIWASVESTHKLSFVSARSAGYDGQFGTSDDIIVGGNPQ